MSTLQSGDAAAAVRDLAATIQLVVRQDVHDREAQETAWENIMALWLLGDTKDVIPALVQSQVNDRLFLAKLLCRIWAKYLGESPRVMGGYIAEHEDSMMRAGGKNLNPKQLNTTRLLIHCGCLHPPIEGPDKDRLTVRAWSHIHRAPHNPQWSDLLPSLDTSDDASKRIQSIVQEAQDSQMDLDWLVAHCLYALPGGVVGYGQSIEARAFLFCYVSGAYDFDRDVLALQSPSTRSHELLPTLHTLHPYPQVSEPTKIANSTLLYIFLEQMCPIIESFPSPHLVAAPQATTTPTHRDSPARSLLRPSQLEGLHPFWLFAIDLSLQSGRKQTKALWEMLGPLLSPACVHYEHLYLPSPPGPSTTLSKKPISLMAIVASTIAGNCFYEGTSSDDDSLAPADPAVGQTTSQDLPAAVQAVPMQKPEAKDKVGDSSSSQDHNTKWHPVLRRTHLKRTLSFRIMDVDVALRSWPDSFLTKAWAHALPGLLTALALSIISAEPAMYSGCVRAAAGAMVDVYRFDNVLEKLDQERLSFFWLQFVAQCGEYADAFQETMIEQIDRKTAEKVFAALNLLDPFADDEIKLKVAPLQKVYANKAYTMTQNLPSHLIDRFVEICIELCRRKTAIAQALADGSFVTLLTAIQDGVYVYSEEQDLQPPEVRAIVRQQMCKEAFAVLADCL